MNVLITGAGGFLGKHLIKGLLENEKIKIFANTLISSDLDEFIGKIDIIPTEELGKVDFESIDIVINCAFPRAVKGPGFAKGLDFIVDLLKLIQPYNNVGFIDISSQSVYSYTRDDIADEDSPVILEDSYDTGKYLIEQMSNVMLKDHKLVHLRLASLVGAGFDQRLTNKFVKKIIGGEDILIRGGKQTFGFLDVRDCASAIYSVVDKWDAIEIGAYTYNVCPRDNHNLLVLAQKSIEIGKMYGYDKTKLSIEDSDDYKSSALSSKTFTQDFGWIAKYSIEETLKSIFEYEIDKTN
ncbi:MAG: NAD(P)-dependent oxidoreductase [Eubacterium sp.]|nr:NAD(P)-dependent oxidoreductase [Eubacterium sp.]